MNTSMQNKPSLVTAIGIMTLVNGIFNLIYGASLILGTIGLALLCGIALLPIILGGFEIAYAMKLLANPAQPLMPSRAIAWWEIAAVLSGNFLSLVVGILALVFYSDSTVMDYFARLNSAQTPPAPPSNPQAAPALPVESTPAPAAPPADETPAWLKAEESVSEAAPASPAEAEAKPAKKKSPAKPKTVRKPASKK